MFAAKIGTNHHFVPNYFDKSSAPLLTSSSESNEMKSSDDENECQSSSVEGLTDLATNDVVVTTPPDIEKSKDEGKSVDENKEVKNKDSCSDDETDISISYRNKAIKKASVAVAGGALITAGVPLIPVLCAGELMIVGGMALLATEFDSAKNVLHKGRKRLEQFASKEEEEGIGDADSVNGEKNVLENNDQDPSDVMRDAEKKNNETITTSQSEQRKSKASEELSKISKKLQSSMRKMVKHDILPVIDKFAPTKEECKGN